MWWIIRIHCVKREQPLKKPLEPLSNTVEQWRLIPKRLLITVDQLVLAKTAVTVTSCIVSRDPEGTTFSTFKKIYDTF